MSSQTYYIKSMVCQRCIDAVKEIFYTANNNTIEYIGLGEIIVSHPIPEHELAQIENLLKQKGFELLNDRQKQLIAKIKALILEHIQKPDDFPGNISEFLASQLFYDYSYLSKLFSTFEGITIERFFILQKIEKIKELIFYDEMSISQIAGILNYSSVAHLSAQFKKETGLTPTQFRQLKQPGHQALDRL